MSNAYPQSPASETASLEGHAASNAKPLRSAECIPQAHSSPAAASVQVRNDDLDKRALYALLAQHLSSTWGDRCAEFAFYLFLITLFKDTLLPASIFGFSTTGVAILFSGTAGSLVDWRARLPFVRICILLQKGSSSAAYTLFLMLFLRLRGETEAGVHVHALVWILFAVIILCGCVLKLATVGISVAIERDWVTVIADGDSEKLTRLNTYLRRIDLLSKLVAPLFVSLLTTVASYSFSAAFLLGFGIISMVFEFIWIGVVYRRLPMLGAEEQARNMQRQESIANAANPRLRTPLQQNVLGLLRNFVLSLKQNTNDWGEFIRSPIFPSSLSISLLYLTVLSFDGTMLSYLKTHQFSDVFLAGMRAICVISGLFGTLLMPWLEKRIGIIRAGIWSIMSEVVTLVPVLLSFYIGAPKDGERGSAWNSSMLFAGMALSRIGLWAFDLCQLKEVQTTLATHPRRNAITALQLSLQNVADLTKYALTIILSRPAQFKYAALVSFAAICLGAVCYLYYSWRERGHLLHLDWKDGFFKKNI